MADAASTLHVSTSTLKSDLKSGQTMADIAKSQGVPVQTLETALVGDATQAINTAVSQNKLTAAEAATIKGRLQNRVDALVTQGPRRFHRPHRFVGGHVLHKTLLKDASSALGISPSTLRSDLASGKTLASIADAQPGNSAAKLEQTLTTDATQAVNGLVSQNKLTSAQATQLKSHLKQWVDMVVTHSAPGPEGSMGKAGPMMKTLMGDVASSLGVSPRTLRSDLQSGQTLASIAKAHNISTTALEKTLQSDAKTALGTAVAQGAISQTQASQIERSLSIWLPTLINSSMPPMAHHPMGGWHQPPMTAQ